MKDDKSVASCVDGKSVSNYSDDASWMVDKEEPDGTNIAHRETSTIWKWKLAVVLVLVAGTIGAALAVSRYTHDSEIEKFHSAFAKDAAKVSSAIAKSLEQTVGALDGLAATLVSHAAHSNQSWPQISLPDFAIHASKVLPISNALRSIPTAHRPPMAVAITAALAQQQPPPLAAMHTPVSHQSDAP
jgi:hypothetical protein